MRMTEPLDKQITSVGNVPKLESIYGIAVYDEKDGKVIHIHTILNMEGASPVDYEEKEKEVLEYAKKGLNRDTTKLKVLHAPNMQEISGQYYVNVKDNTLVKIPESEILKKLRDLRKGE